MKFTLNDFKFSLNSIKSKKNLITSNFDLFEFNFLFDFEKIFISQNPVYLLHKKSKKLEIKLKLANLLNNVGNKKPKKEDEENQEEQEEILKPITEDSNLIQNLMFYFPKEV